MPTQAEIDQKALDYGVLVAGIEKAKTELNRVNAELDTNKTLNERLTKQNEEASAAFDKLHGQVTDMEKEIEEKRRLAQEENANEDRRLAAERKALADAIVQHEKLVDLLDKREADVESKEGVMKDREALVEQRLRAIVDTESKLEVREKKVKEEVEAATSLKKEAERLMEEAGTRLRDAKAAESAATSAKETNTKLATQCDDDMRQAAADRHAAEDKLAQAQRIHDQTTRLTDVLTEHIKFISDNVKKSDTILNHFAVHYPDIADKLVKPNPKK